MNRIRFHLLLVSLISVTFFFFSCTRDKSPEIEKPVVKNEDINDNIVLIFKKMPDNAKLIHPKGGMYNKGLHEISYSSGKYQNTVWVPKNYLKKSDTLVIKGVNSKLEINHKYKALEDFSYLFHAGDTIVFKYNGNIPSVVVKNRNVNKFDYNFEAHIKEQSSKNSIQSYVQLFNLPYIEIVNMLDGQFISKSKLKQSLSKEGEAELLRQKVILDSLYLIQEISEENYIHYGSKLTYQLRQIDLVMGKLSDTSLQLQNDTLLKYSYFQNYLRQYLQYRYYENDKVKLAQSKTPDYRLIYDSIILNGQLNPNIKKHLLYKTMINLVNQASAEDIKHYFDRYKESNFSDSVSIALLKSDYNIGKEISNDLVLISNDGTEKSFEDLLTKHEGKTIYIDFWASWCKPCRVIMPSSRMLREELKNEKVAFIYLAYNDKFTNWVDASKKELLSDYSENYFIKNSKSTNFIENHKIYEIPRYMIYDQRGKVKFSNAPSPNDSRVKSAILN